MKPPYIALEGIEGSGKSTVASRLVDLLADGPRRVTRVREPGGTVAGERIRGVLLDTGSFLSPWAEALLFAASRAQLAHEVVGPALESGSWVISDRTVYSSLAYQGGGRGLGIATVRALNEPGLEGLWPDLVVLLRIDAATGLERQEVADRIGGEGLEFQAAVAAAFDEIARAEPERFLVVDANQDITAVIDDVVAGVLARW
jgi:dTMP kinase